MMSVGLLGEGVKLTPPPQHIINKFYGVGVEIWYRGVQLSSLPSNAALMVGPWEWRTLVIGDPNPNLRHFAF